MQHFVQVLLRDVLFRRRELQKECKHIAETYCLVAIFHLVLTPIWRCWRLRAEFA